MRQIYGVTFLSLFLLSGTALAVEQQNPATGSGSAFLQQTGAMASGTPLQGGMSADAQKQLNVMSQTTPRGWAPSGFVTNQPLTGGMSPSGFAAGPGQMYMEKPLQPSVLDAPPAWAQGRLLPQASLLLAPFGANMFHGNFSSTYSDGMNGEYVIMPGDRIVVRVWGAKTYDDVLPVDQQGNIFLPEVGPVHVGGLHQSSLQSAVKSKLSSVFTNNVNIYVNLQSAQPVAVYVTGFVVNPGRYAGGSMDSILSYLDRAGGILPDRGSYRRIQIKRGRRVIDVMDLYDFAMNGNLPDLRMEDGDVILVGERGPSVAACGMLRQEARYEFVNGTSGAQLMRYARPLPNATHVSIAGIRKGKPLHRYLTIGDFAKVSLADGDEVEFVSDVRGQTIIASVTGAIRGESRFPVRNSSTLRALLAHVEVDPAIADTGSVYIRRQSVARQQTQILKDSLQRLEHSTLTATSATAEEAQIRVKEAELVHDFVQRAVSLNPDGVVVVSHNGQVKDLLLEDGDVVVIPQKSDVVQVSGEVMLPKAVAYDSHMGLEDYLKNAGGYTDRADKGAVLVARMNGEVGLVSEMGIHPGDSILVMPKVEVKSMELAKGISQILYQIAVATRIALKL